MSGILDFTNNNNNNNNNNGESAKEHGRRDATTASDAVPPSPGEQLADSASPLTPADSSPHTPAGLDRTSTPRTRDGADTDTALCHSIELASGRSSAASDYSPPSNACFPEPAAVYQQYAASLNSSSSSAAAVAFLGSSPVKGLVGLGGGGAVRCPPVREAVDPAKYITISGEPDGVKYACSKCGNIYKWRKSLNKHWKEKHDGETPPDPAGTAAAANRYVRLPTPVAKRPSPTPFSTAASSAARPLPSVTRPLTGVRGSLAAILPPLPSRSGVTYKAWNHQSAGSMALQSAPQLKTPTFADYKASSSAVAASPFSVLAVDSVLSKERPVDLSGSASRTHVVDERLDDGGLVLDLSRKGCGGDISPYVSTRVQDEPIDFSTKTASLRNTPAYESEFYAATATTAGRPLEAAHAGGGGTLSLHCAQCRQKFTGPGKLNRHFADTHSDLLAAAAVADEAGSGTQLYRYLTTERPAPAVRCVVCGASFSWRAAAARHFDHEHAVLRPNPYQQPSDSADSGSSTPRRGAALRCGRCPFTTDSYSVLARHHLRHSPRRDLDRVLWGAGGGDDVKAACTELQLLSATAVNMDDVIGENTAIVIPQAPEDSAASAAAAAKPVKATSGGARSTGGRGKRADVGGSGTASAETLLPFKCELCEYRARWPSEMTQHAKNHSDEKPYHCPQCTYRSKWKWDVVKHLKRCGGGGTARDVIDTTTNTATPSSLATAPVVSQSTRRRRTNVRSLLTDAQPTTQTTPSYERGTASGQERPAQPYSTMSTTASSSEHLPNGNPGTVVCSRVQDTNADRVAAAVQTVGVDTVTTTALSRPAESVSPPPPAPMVGLVNAGLHYCLQCSFVGHSPAELRRHLRVHSDEKPYSCRTCCYSSKWKCDLKKHLRAYNHVSAVPLAYGGHGRKPASDKDGHDADDELTGPVDDDCIAADVGETAADSGSQPAPLKSGVATKTPRLPNGSSFGGITAGGRLRCRRCDFEAIDLTSFLQHKSTHAASRSDAGDQLELHSAAAAPTSRPSHRRRKSSKQVRVLPESKCGKTTSDDGVEARSASDDQVDAVDGSKFWTSLGLRSKTGVVGGVQSAEAAIVKGSSLMDATVDDRQNEPDTDAELDSVDLGDDCLIVDDEMAADSMTPSPAASTSSDTDVELIDLDQPVDLCRRRVCESAPLTSHSAQLTPGVTTSPGDDASAGISKRKRRLRACEKCGYVTDNLTTLQRHAAKHGSTGTSVTFWFLLSSSPVHLV